MNDEIKSSLNWFEQNYSSPHTANMSRDYKDGLIFALREYLGIEQNPIEDVKRDGDPQQFQKGYEDGQNVISNVRAKYYD